MNEITKCQVKGCDGDMIKSGGVLRSSGKVQRFQCRKCGWLYVSDIPFNGSGKRIREKESLQKARDEEKPLSGQKHPLQSPKCESCNELMTRTYVYRKKKNSKSGNWLPIGWSCILCKKIIFTDPEESPSTEEDISDIGRQERIQSDQPHPQKKISPKDERFCADIVITGSKPVPQDALDLLKRIETRNLAEQNSRTNSKSTN